MEEASWEASLWLTDGLAAVFLEIFTERTEMTVLALFSRNPTQSGIKYSLVLFHEGGEEPKRERIPQGEVLFHNEVRIS